MLEITPDTLLQMTMLEIQDLGYQLRHASTTSNVLFVSWSKPVDANNIAEVCWVNEPGTPAEGCIYFSVMLQNNDLLSLNLGVSMLLNQTDVVSRYFSETLYMCYDPKLITPESANALWQEPSHYDLRELTPEQLQTTLKDYATSMFGNRPR